MKLVILDKKILKQVIFFVCVMFLFVTPASSICESYDPTIACVYWTSPGSNAFTFDLYKDSSLYQTGIVSGYHAYAIAAVQGQHLINLVSTPFIDGGYYPVSNYSNTINFSVAQFTDMTGDYKLIGASVVWDKSTYSKGEVATITISFNSSNFNRNLYRYEYYVTDPVTSQGFWLTDEILQSTTVRTLVMANEGTYEGTFFLSTRADPDQAFYYIHDYKIVSGAEPVSFVTWDKHSYAVSATGKISYGVSSSYQDFLYSKFIDVYKDNILIKSYDNLDSFGSINYPLGGVGTYLVKFGYRSMIHPSGDTILKTDTAQVIYKPSLLTVNSTITTGAVANFTYMWGFTPTQSGFKWLYLKHYNSDSMQWDIESTTAITGTVKDIVYSSSVFIKSEGKYIFQLCDLNYECPAALAYATSIVQPFTPIINYGTSDITILNKLLTYSMNDWLFYSIKVDGGNFTDMSTKWVELYNNATGINKTLFYVLHESENSKIYLSSSMDAGASQLRLMGKNDSITKILDFDILTISAIDTDGYGLFANPSKVCKGGLTVVTAISPGNSTIRFTDNKISQYNFSGTRSWEISPSDDMTISLDDMYGLQKKMINIDVDSSCVYLVDDIDTDIGINNSDTGFGVGESPGDLIYNYKQIVYGFIGTSEGTLFLMGIFHVIIFGIACLLFSKGMPIMFGIGALLGLAFSVSIAFIPMVWGVVILVLGGLTFMGMMKKG